MEARRTDLVRVKYLCQQFSACLAFWPHGGDEMGSIGTTGRRFKSCHGEKTM
jgi:hypothetical protein